MFAKFFFRKSAFTSRSPTPRQIQYGGFRRACLGKSADMIRDRVRILCLLFLWKKPVCPGKNMDTEVSKLS